MGRLVGLFGAILGEIVVAAAATGGHLHPGVSLPLLIVGGLVIFGSARPAAEKGHGTDAVAAALALVVGLGAFTYLSEPGSEPPWPAGMRAIPGAEATGDVNLDSLWAQAMDRADGEVPGGSARVLQGTWNKKGTASLSVEIYDERSGERVTLFWEDSSGWRAPDRHAVPPSARETFDGRKLTLDFADAIRHVGREATAVGSPGDWGSMIEIVRPDANLWVDGAPVDPTLPLVTIGRTSTGSDVTHALGDGRRPDTWFTAVDTHRTIEVFRRAIAQAGFDPGAIRIATFIGRTTEPGTPTVTASSIQNSGGQLAVVTQDGRWAEIVIIPGSFPLVKQKHRVVRATIGMGELDPGVLARILADVGSRATLEERERRLVDYTLQSSSDGIYWEVQRGTHGGAEGRYSTTGEALPGR